MHVIDLTGEHHSAQLTTTWDGELNGNQNLTAIVKPSKVNLQFIHDITEMWQIVDDDDTAYKVVYCKRQGSGKLLTVEVKALPKYQDDLNTQRVYERYDEHMTANAFFHVVFDGSGYNFILNGTFEAQQWEGLGEGATRLDMFKEGLNRYKAEFRISGNTIYIENQIGNDTSHRYEHRLNASNIVQEIDANEFYTYAKGYGDYGGNSEGGATGDDWQNAKLIREYTSPLAQIPSIGIRHAPPIQNGNITLKETMDSQLKILVDESLKISVSADIHDLTKQGYPIAQSNLGDRVFLIDKRIGFDEEIRIAQKSITRNWKGEIIDLKLTFGVPGLVKRHQSNLSAATKNITALLEGKIKLPFSVLDNAVAEATKALQNITSELSVPPNGGLMAIDKENPNNLVLFNAAGLGVSTDGGATFENAITGQGINGKAIIAKTVVADAIAGGILMSLNGSTEFNLNTGDLIMENAHFVLGGGATIDFTDSGNSMLYELYDATDGYGRLAGMGVGKSVDSRFPFAYLGTYAGEVMDTLGPHFSGLFVNTVSRIRDHDSANSIVGRRWRMVSDTEYEKGIYVDFFTNEMYPINTGSHNYDLGIENNRWNQLWVNRLRVPNDFLIQNIWDANIGWRMETQYSGDGHGISLYPTFTGSYNYVIGKTTNKLTNVFSDWFTGSVDSSSSVNSKMNIEELDPKIAFDYVNMMNLYTYYYQDTDYTNPYEKRVSPIIEQLDPANGNLFKASESTLDINSNLFLFIAAFKHKNGITDNEISLLKEKNTITDNEIILIKERLEMLENGTEPTTA